MRIYFHNDHMKNTIYIQTFQINFNQRKTLWTQVQNVRIIIHIIIGKNHIQEKYVPKTNLYQKAGKDTE